MVASTENMAVFGQANVNFTDDFRLIVGGRFLHEVGIAEKFRVDPSTTSTRLSVPAT